MSCWLGIVSQKGGVGKTTVALNLSVALAERGNRTLLIDTDPQGGIGLSLGKTQQELVGLWDLLDQQLEFQDAILQTKLPRLSLLPLGILPPSQIHTFETKIFQSQVLNTLKQATRSGQIPFDVVIVDTPAGLGLITRKVLSIVDHVLIPSQAEALSLRSLSQAVDVVKHVQASENTALSLLGILPTMVERQSDHSLHMLTELWRNFGHVLDASIPRAEVFPQASIAGVPLAFLPGVKSPEAQRFELLAAEIEERIYLSESTESGTLRKLL